MSIAWSTTSLSCLPSQPVTNVISILLKARGQSLFCSPSTSTDNDLRGCLNFLRSSTALIPVQVPSAARSISVGRMASSSPKSGASSTVAVCPEPDTTSNLTLCPDQLAVTLGTYATSCRLSKI